MAYLDVAQRIATLERKVANLEEAFNEFLELTFEEEIISEEERKELEKIIKDITEGQEKLIPLEDLEKELGA